MKTNHRLASLDFFRGATVAAMIIVNDPGSYETTYPQLAHAVWEGCTATDLIFPFFLFIVGVSITLAFERAILKGNSKKRLLAKVFKRGGIIFLLGLFLNLFPFFDFSAFRIPGVLQRIALVYVFCSILYLYAGKRAQLIWFCALLVGYYVILTFIPVPQVGAANLNPTNNFAAWFDRLILNGFLGRNGSAQFDTTGIFSTIPAIASGLTGVLVGHLLLVKKKNQPTKVIWIVIAGNVLMLIGWLWSLEFPMIKRIWTSSYVLYSSGIAMVCFAISLWFIDILKYKKLIKPFLAFGVNALIAYFISGLLVKLTSIDIFMYRGDITSVKEWLFSVVLSSVLNPYNASLAYALLNTSVIFLLIWRLYRKGIVIKV